MSEPIACQHAWSTVAEKIERGRWNDIDELSLAICRECGALRTRFNYGEAILLPMKETA